jgi:hypothetical protein
MHRHPMTRVPQPSTIRSDPTVSRQLESTSRIGPLPWLRIGRHEGRYKGARPRTMIGTTGLVGLVASDVVYDALGTIVSILDVGAPGAVWDSL